MPTTVTSTPTRSVGPGVAKTDPTIDVIRDAAEAILPDVIEIRRRLHRRPEIGLHLPGTQAVIPRRRISRSIACL